MSSSPGFDVFLSYSHLDQSWVREVASRLRSDGLRIWFDEWEIQTGSDVSFEINSGIDKARVLVVCVSRHSATSVWRQLETQTFLWRHRRSDLGSRVIVLRLDESKVNKAFEEFTLIDWRPSARELSYPRLLAASRLEQSSW